MQTIRILFGYFLLALVSVLTGCDKPVAAPDPAEKLIETPAQANPETPATQPVGESMPSSSSESPAMASGSGAATEDSAAADVTDEPAALELNAPMGQANNSAQAVEVDHNDPTSYPITEFVAKQAGQVMMFSWNVESDGAEADTICKELKELNANDRYDVVALTEVLPEDFKKFQSALGSHYEYAHTKSGRSDRMQILYNEDKFEKVRHFEIDEINIRKRYRAPLVVHLKERKTDERPDEIEFLVMVNHLARGKAEIRQKQSTMLVEWAREQNLPVFALGDYNFDYEFATEKGNPAFVNFMQDNIWSWVKPIEMIDNNWYDNPKEPDGKDDYPGSLLDFAFVAGPAKDWKTSCRIIVRENDFPDDEKTSDHRPYEVTAQK